MYTSAVRAGCTEDGTAATPSPCSQSSTDSTNPIYVRVLLPVVAGVAFEFIRLAGKSEHPLVCAISKPGLALQKLTTREPDESMVEVAIAAVEAVFDWKNYLRENFGYKEFESEREAQ